jgi:uncharacterized protein (DUF2235 family)
MAKRLVLCCDGTWNTADQKCPTNVTKMALGVAERGDDGLEQCVYYHSGVGTSRRERISGGAFGVGLSRNVQDTYRFVVENYEPGDELFFFGFSRGAFTARSAVGLVRNSGILRPRYADRVPQAYALYRDRRTHPRGTDAQLFRRSYSYETRIRFVGVWDTVGALGIPLSGGGAVDAANRRWQFHDTDLSTSVDAAFQALAIDEKRRPFEPTLWQQQPDAVGQRLEQVWFAGVHSDVGGGYPEGALADVALMWMVSRAESCGLTFRDQAFPPVAPPGTTAETIVVNPDARGQLHESRTGMYRLTPALHRPIGGKERGHEYVASSAVLRRDDDATYAPERLVEYLAGRHEVMEVAKPEPVA